MKGRVALGKMSRVSGRGEVDRADVAKRESGCKGGGERGNELMIVSRNWASVVFNLKCKINNGA